MQLHIKMSYLAKFKQQIIKLIVIILSLVSFVYLMFNKQNIKMDESSRIFAAKNISTTGRYSVTRYNIETDKFEDQPLYAAWPVLESYLISKSENISKNHFQTHLILKLISSIVLVIALYFLFQIYLNSIRLTIIGLALFTMNPLMIRYLWSSDLHAFSLSVIAIFYVINLLKHKPLFSIKNEQLLLLSIFFILPSLFRFGNYGFGLVPLFLLIITSFKHKNQNTRKLWTKLIITFIIPFMFIMIQTNFVSSNSETIYVTNNQQSGVFLSNFRLATPPLSSMLLGLNTSTIVQLNKLFVFDITKNTIALVALLIALVEYVILGFVLLKLSFSKNSIRTLYLLIILSIYTPLVLLTISKKPILLNDGLWSYLSEPRYLLVPFLVIVLIVLSQLKNIKNANKNLILGGTLVFYIGCMYSTHKYKKNLKYANINDYYTLANQSKKINKNDVYICSDAFTTDYLVSNQYKVFFTAFNESSNHWLVDKNFNVLTTNQEEIDYCTTLDRSMKIIKLYTE
jgi:hypothetical protein